MPDTPCSRPGCDGTITPAGFCDTCGIPALTPYGAYPPGTLPPDTAPAAEADMRIGPANITGILSQAASCTFYLAEKRGRRFILQEFNDVPSTDATRMELAARIASLRLVRHPVIAEIVDVDAFAPKPYIVTSYRECRSLRAIVNESGPLRGMRLARLAEGLAGGIVELQRANVVHDSIDADTVLLTDDRPLLIGLGTTVAEPRESSTHRRIPTDYTAPEFYLEQGRLSDVYSCAATIAYAATGRPVRFQGVVEPDLDEVPEPLRSLLRHALATEPDHYSSAQELLDGIREWIQRDPALALMDVPPSSGPGWSPHQPQQGMSFPSGAVTPAPYQLLPRVVSGVLIAVVLLSGVLWLVGPGRAHAAWISSAVIALTLAGLIVRRAFTADWVGTIRLARARRQLARGQYQKAEAILRGSDSSSVTVQACLASALRGQGRFDEAQSAYKGALVAAQRAPVPDQAQIARLTANMAVVQHDLLAPGSEPALRSVVESTAAGDARSNLAVALLDEERLEEAEREMRAALEQRADAPVLQANLAAILRDRGAPEAAEKLLTEAARNARRSLGRRHPETLTIRASLAAVQHELGRHAEAEALLRGVITDRMRILGRHHPATLSARTSLGFMRLAEGDDDMAEHEFTAVLRDAENPDLATVKRAQQGRELVAERRRDAGA